MRIIGYNLKKLQAERKKQPEGKINVSSNLDILGIEKEKIDIAGEILNFSYEYSIKYEPGIGEILFKGEVLVLCDNQKDVLKNWKKKKIKDDIRLPLFNFIMSKCNLKALQIEEEFSLPPHIPLPKLSKPSPNNKQNSPANYTG